MNTTNTHIADAMESNGEVFLLDTSPSSGEPGANAIASLRHLYKNLMNGGVRDTASAKRIATGLLGPAIESLERSSAPAAEPVASFAELIHYPGHWDTAAYPTLKSAIHEVLASTGCSVCRDPEAYGVDTQQGERKYPPLPKPDIRVDAFGEIAATDRRGFVMGDFYTAAQMRAYVDADRAALSQRAPTAAVEGDMSGVRARLQNSVNWQVHGRHTGELVGSGDFQKLIAWLDSSPAPTAAAEAARFSCHLERAFGKEPCDHDCGKLRCMYPSSSASTEAAPEEPAVALGACPWGDLKVAFDVEDPIALWASHDDGTLALPEGWSLIKTEGAGARMLAIFRVDGMPTLADGEAVHAALVLAQGGSK